MSERSTPVRKPSGASTAGYTISGPGGWPGKMFLALGTAILDGLDELMIQWRLARMSSLVESIGDGSNGSAEAHPRSGRYRTLSRIPGLRKRAPKEKSLRKMYKAIIELSRRDGNERYLYSTKKRTKAFKIVLLMISKGETSLLVQCLLEESQMVARGILNEVLLCMHPNYIGLPNDRNKMHQKLFNFYLSAESSSRRNNHLAAPFFTFFRQVAEANESGVKMLFDIGILDSLFTMYLNDLLPSTTSLNRSHQGREHLKISHFTVCDGLLALFSVEKYKHAIHDLWPRPMPDPITTGEVCAIRNRRRAAWKDPSISQGDMVERIASIKEMMTLSIRTLDGIPQRSNEVLDMYADLVEFSNPDGMFDGIVEQATKVLVDILGNDFDVVATLKAYGANGIEADSCPGPLGLVPKAMEHRASYMSLLDAFALGQIFKTTQDSVKVIISPLPKCCPSLKHWHRIALSSIPSDLVYDESHLVLIPEVADEGAQIISDLEEKDSALALREIKLLVGLLEVRKARSQLRLQIAGIHGGNPATE